MVFRLRRKMEGMIPRNWKTSYFCHLGDETAHEASNLIQCIVKKKQPVNTFLRNRTTISETGDARNQALF